MKAGIVSLATLGKYNRWDAGFYLADTTELDPAIERAKKAIEDAQARLKRLEEEKAAGAEFTGGLIRSGELIPIIVKHQPQTEDEQTESNREPDPGGADQDEGA